MTAADPLIAGVELAATHDGEAALLVELRYANGAAARVQLSSEEARQVMQRAGVQTAAELRGRSWELLCLQPVLGPRPLPRR